MISHAADVERVDVHHEGVVGIQPLRKLAKGGRPKLWAYFDKELVEGVMQFSFVDPLSEGVKERLRNVFEEVVGEGLDKGITVGCVGVD